MLEITLEFDRRAFDSAADSFVNGEVQTALVGAVNATAERVRIALRNSMLTAFDRPKPFTLEGIAVYKATPRTDGGTPSALVFVRETQAAYLDLEMHGGVRRAGDVGTTRLGPLVPGARAPKDRFGGLPLNFVAEALQDKDVAWVTLRPGEPPALVRKRPGCTWRSSPSSRPRRGTRRPGISTGRPRTPSRTRGRMHPPRACRRRR